jgi:hypothetical protein
VQPLLGEDLGRDRVIISDRFPNCTPARPANRAGLIAVAISMR